MSDFVLIGFVSACVLTGYAMAGRYYRVAAGWFVVAALLVWSL